jgi:hypothetical protein
MLLGGALTFGCIHFLDLVGLALVVVSVVAGLLLARAVGPEDRAELVGLAAGPGLLFVVVGERDDAPGLGGIGLLLLAATAAVYLGLRRRQSAGAA